MVADAWHQRSDVVTSVAALGGITVAWVAARGGVTPTVGGDAGELVAGGDGLWLLGPGLARIDGRLGRPGVVEFIAETGKSCEGIRGIDKVWVRKLGMRLMVDMHIVVDPDISVQEGHRLAHEVKAGCNGNCRRCAT